MARATLILPRVLLESVGSTRLRVEGVTLRDAFEDAYRQVPALRHHLLDEKGGFRAHVLCFHEGERHPMNTKLKDGDEISIFQAISGG
ncbi:MAG TPA: MoaD/ThiS family protein [Planctomycetota bacterium]|nr:MoaD/ThiS family protein [Planctomycetota bacterium]